MPASEILPSLSTAPPVALTIAGSDPSGGAGIQADLKTFHALGVYGAAVLTALTAQNTRGVSGVHAVPAEFVWAQIEEVVTDVPPDAVKTGMLGSRAVVLAVARAADEFDLAPLVVDPVMVATSGDRLLDEGAEATIRDELLPRAALVTPNAPEAAVLSGLVVAGLDDLERAARRIVHELGARAALVKSGDLPGELIRDVLYDGATLEVFEEPKLRTRSTHGSGCTLAAAIAAYLARGEAMAGAVRRARAFTRRAIEEAFPLGAGNGPLNHFVRPPE
ncbi:MAG: bifunctional hydroxymethylpyrimidine kinase/phosphomethylpyrimidine kinase [Gemmatimonadota bacterium]